MALKRVVDCCSVLILVCAIVTFIGHVVAFATHYWFESVPGHNEFKNAGMHEICFDGFRHPRGDFDNKYYGCYGYWDDYYLQIRVYLTPGWFMRVRNLVFANLGVAIFTFFFGIVCFLIMVMERCLSMHCGAPCQVFFLIFTAAAFFATGLVELMAVAFFYSNCYDREWMPRPEWNRFGYSFWMAVGVCVASLVGFMACVIGTIFRILDAHEEKESVDSDVILGRH